MGRRIRAVVACLVPAAFPARAERLPVRAFATEDGLPSAFVQVIVPDPRGFVWIGTRAGIARYDGERFVVSTVREGLPASTVTAFVPTADGGAWVGTQGGLCRFAARPSSAPLGEAPPLGEEAGPRCEPVPLDGAQTAIGGLVLDGNGRLWVGDASGLYREDGAAFRKVGAGWPLARDARGAVVVAEGGGKLVFRKADGTEERLGGEAFTVVRRATPGPGGALWLATDRGAQLLEAEGEGAPRVTRRLGKEDGLPAGYVLSALVTRDGTTYLGTEAGLARLDTAGRLERLSPAQGIPAIRIFTLAEDRAGNVWAGTPLGAFRITAGGLVSHPDVPSLPTEISSLSPEGDGVFVAGDRWTFGPFDGKAFRARTLVLPEGTRDLWAGQVVFRDSRGRVYALSSAGIFREERDGRARLFYAPLTPQDLPKRMLETASGDLLIGSFHGLVIWERAREAFRRIEPFHEGGGAHRVLALAVSPEGTFFAGYDDGTLVRVRPGETRESRVAQPFGDTPLTALLFDRAGRLWAGGAEGGSRSSRTPNGTFPRSSLRRGGERPKGCP